MFKREYYIIVFLHKLVKRQSFLSTFRLTTKSSSQSSLQQSLNPVDGCCMFALIISQELRIRFKKKTQFWSEKNWA